MQKNKEIIVYNEEEFLKYLSHKRAESLIFAGLENYNLEDSFYADYPISDEFIGRLKAMAVMNGLLEYYGKSVKKNMYDIVAYISSEKPYNTQTERQQLLEELNTIKGLLNISNSSNEISFYRNQLFLRTPVEGTKRLRRMYNDQVIEECIPALNETISYDYDIINNLSFPESELEFIKEIVPENLLDHHFINTVNMLLCEQPQFFIKTEYLDRVKFILKNNQRLLYGTGSIYEMQDCFEKDSEILVRTNRLVKKLDKMK